MKTSVKAALVVALCRRDIRSLGFLVLLILAVVMPFGQVSRAQTATCEIPSASLGAGATHLDATDTWLAKGSGSSVELHKKVNEVWQLDQSLDLLGASISSMDLDGSLLALGLQNEVRVYSLAPDGTWTEELTVPGVANGDLGRSIGLSGIHLAIGDPANNEVLFYSRLINPANNSPMWFSSSQNTGDAGGSLGDQLNLVPGYAASLDSASGKVQIFKPVGGTSLEWELDSELITTATSLSLNEVGNTLRLLLTTSTGGEIHVRNANWELEAQLGFTPTAQTHQAMLGDSIAVVSMDCGVRVFTLSGGLWDSGVNLQSTDLAQGCLQLSELAGGKSAPLALDSDGLILGTSSQTYLITELTYLDCNGNGQPDDCDISDGLPDCNGNGIPDSCDFSTGSFDCNTNGVIDTCEIEQGFTVDCNSNGIPDSCENAATYDAVPPTISNIPQDQVFEILAGGACTITTSWIDPTSEDLCSASTITSDTPMETVFGPGVHLVTYTAEDVSGNQSVATFTITVNLTEVPTFLTQPSNMTVGTNPDSCDAVVLWAEPTVEDQCGGNNVTITSNRENGSVFPLGQTMVIMNATDVSGNVKSIAFLITVEDQSPPVIEQLPNIVASTLSTTCSAAVTWVDPIIQDCSPGVTFTKNFGQPLVGLPGTRNVIYTATDAQGLISTMSFSIVVVDDTPPTLVGVPSNMILNTDPGSCGATVLWDIPTVIDNCALELEPISNFEPPSTFGVGVTTVHYSALDPSGNETTASFTVTVNDLDTPVFLSSPGSLSVATTSELCTEPVSWVPPVAIDCSANLSYVSSHEPGSEFPIGQTEVTYTVSDLAGFSSSLSFSVLVTDGFGPTFSGVPQDIFQSPAVGDCSATVSWVEPTATDLCGASTVSSNLSPGTLFPVGTTQVEYTATDDSGNSSIATFNVIVADTAPPEFTSIPENIEISTVLGTCQAQVFWTSLGAIDPNCPDAEISVTSSHSPGDFFSKGVTTVTYQATAGQSIAETSFTVTVNDIEAPTLFNMPSNITVPSTSGTCQATVVWVLPVAFDECDEVGFSASHFPGSVFGIGETTVSYTSTDLSGNSTEATFTISVVDHDNPVFVGEALVNISTTIEPGSCGATVFWDPPVALDACDTELTLVATNEPGSIFPVGNTLVTYTATDDFGNSDVTFFSVQVVDNEAPIFVGVPDSMQVGVDADQCAASASWQDPVPTDCHSVTVSKTHESGSVFNLGDTTVTYTATDVLGNQSTASFVVTVIDNRAPEFTVFPDNISVTNDLGQCDAIVSWSDLAALDSCTDSTITLSIASGEVFSQGVTTVTATVIDTVGNTHAQDFTVTVIDSESPSVVSGPTSPIFVGNSNQDCTALASWTPPAFGDNCTGELTVSSTHHPGDTFPVGETLVTYTALDPDLNSQSYEFSVVVLDTTNPEILSMPENVSATTPVDSCLATVSWIDPTVSDCGQVTAASDTPNGGQLEIGSHLVNYTFTDDSGNTSEASFLVVVSDGELPAIANMPTNITVTNTTSACGVNVIWAEPTTSDCTFSSLSSNHSMGSQFSIGTTEVIYVATDTAGNQTTDSFEITILDGENPQIHGMPQDITIQAEVGSCNAQAIWSDPEALDCVSASLTSTHSSGDLFEIGVNVVTYTAQDTSGNQSSASFTVNVLDQEAPTILNMPDTVVVSNTPGECSGIATWSEPTGSDCAGISSLTSDLLSGSEFPVGVTSVTYTVLDNSGLQSSSSFDVVVQDNDAPTVLNMPGTVVVQNAPGNCAGVATWDSPSSEDCSGSFLSSDYVSGGMFPLGETTVTYTATDESGNSEVSSFLVIVEDGEAPFFPNLGTTMTFLSNSDSCEGTATWPTPQAADFCSPASTVTVTSSHESGSVFAIGDHSIVFTATDSSGNQHAQIVTVTIVDNEVPTITEIPVDMVGTATLGECGVVMFWNPPTVTDCTETTLSSNYESGAQIPVGLNTIVYTALDSAGNSSQVSFFINVGDAEAPTIEGMPASVVLTNDFDSCGATYAWDEPIISDCSDLFELEISHSSGGFFDPGATLVSYTATDFYGNTSSESFTITVVDKEGPEFLNVVSLVELDSYPGLCGANAFWPEPTVVDNCAVGSLQSSSNQGDFLPLGETVVNYVAIDSEGNANTTSITILIVDNEAPEVINLPAPIIVDPDPATCMATVTWQSPEIADNCDGGILTVEPASGTMFEVGSHTILVTATDSAGLTSQTSFIVTVNDCGTPFLRGDTNSDGAFDISDAIGILNFIFGGGNGEPSCLDSLDENDDGQISIADAIYHFSTLFSGGAPPAAPWDSCGLDPTEDDLDCASYSGCL